MIRLCSLSLLVLLIQVSSTLAQSSPVKSPDEFLQYKLGSRFTPHHLLVDYFKYIDQASDKVQLIQYGQTYELRPLIAVVVSNPENLKRIENIRLNNLRRTGMQTGEVVKEDVAIVYLSYTVHGNEAAGSESSMAVLHDLVKSETNYDAWLRNIVVIIDPCLNPDGYSRYSQWSNSFSAKPFNVRPETRDHNEPWPGGRTNHYYFDLNRDWAWQSQKESRDRVAFYLRWMPQVHADIHEMGSESPYYFAPAAQPYHPYVTAWQASFQKDIGKNHAAHFDREGWRYFTKERYDLFYPSYGDTYPTFAGAIGMTYEQGGGGYSNRAVRLENGDTLTLYDRIAHHREASLSTIEVSSKNAAKLVSEFEMYFKNALVQPPGNIRSYVIKKSNSPGRIADLLALLDLQGIKYGQVKDEMKSLNGYNYLTGEQDSFVAQRGDLVIPVLQPRAVITQVLFEPEGQLNDSLTYDITAWNIPMAYGLEAFATEETVAHVPKSEETKVMLLKDSRPYAYALQWGSVPSAKALAFLLSKGLVARYARDTFLVDSVLFPPGTIVAMRADNRKHPSFDDIMREVSNMPSVSINLIKSGFAQMGKDLGSHDFQRVRKPEVLVFSGSDIRSNSLGEVWHFFEEVLHYPVNLVDIKSANNINLDAYNIILLTEGSYDLDKDVLEDITKWVSSGGRLVAIGSGIRNIAGKDGFGISSKAASAIDTSGREESAHHPEAYDSEDRKSLSEDIPGAIFQTSLNSSHALTFGLGKAYWTLKTNVYAYAWLKGGGNAIYLDDTPHYLGFAGYKAVEKTRKTLVAGQEDKGSGSVVYLVDNPLFRSFWNNGKVLFSNALFF